MNPLSPDTSSTDDLRWRLHLATLPEVDPPAALWVRLQQAQADAQAQARTPRRATWPWMASAAALVVAVIAVQLLRTPQEMGAGITVAPAAETLLLDPSARAGLLRLDAELARAYEQGADSVRLETLRQARSGVVDSFATTAPAELVQL